MEAINSDTNVPVLNNIIKAIVDVEDVKSIFKKNYGLDSLSIKELNGYDDKNYHVLVEENANDNKYIKKVCSDGYVLKFINTLDSQQVEFFEAQNLLLAHLDNNNIKCPKTVKTVDGNYFFIYDSPSGKHLVRLLEFIKGTIIGQTSLTSELLIECGRFLAQINIVTKDFTHEGCKNRLSLWTMYSIPQLPKYLFAITDTEKRKKVESIIEKFNLKVMPACNALPKGLIHGDYNEQNILVQKREDGQWHVDAVLDFGDIYVGCYLFEVSVAIAYMIMQGKDIKNGGYFLAGYTSIKTLLSQELELLKICVAARMCQSLVLGAYFSLQEPTNNYVLTTAKSGWQMLEKLISEPDDITLNTWLKICKNIHFTT